jgi:hypothetical protein
MEVVPDAESVVKAPEEAVVEPIGEFWMDVAVNAPPLVQEGPPVDILAGVIPPSLTMSAPPDNWVVALSTAPVSNVALLTELLSLV